MICILQITIALKNLKKNAPNLIKAIKIVLRFLKYKRSLTLPPPTSQCNNLIHMITFLPIKHYYCSRNYVFRPILTTTLTNITIMLYNKNRTQIHCSNSNRFKNQKKSEKVAIEACLINKIYDKTQFQTKNDLSTRATHLYSTIQSVHLIVTHRLSYMDVVQQRIPESKTINHR